MKRDRLIREIAETISEAKAVHPLRVAVDGVDASGKTTFADELADHLATYQHQMIRASVDGFHHPEAVRRRKGSLSPKGFYRDSYNYQALIENLLLPLSPNGDRRYRTAVFDLRQNQPIEMPWRRAQKDAILIFDGIFLMRRTLLPYWDIKIYIHADFEVSLARGILRDTPLFHSSEEARRRYQQRYIPGQKIYLKDAQPLDKADILIDNNILEDPEIIYDHFKNQ